MQRAAQEMIGRFNEVVQPTYDRTPLVLTKGKGSWVWDFAGRRYLDFFPVSRFDGRKGRPSKRDTGYLSAGIRTGRRGL